MYWSTACHFCYIVHPGDCFTLCKYWYVIFFSKSYTAWFYIIFNVTDKVVKKVIVYTLYTWVGISL